jgi:hypothetical protein
MKLMNFEKFTGQRIVARLFAKTPADAAGDRWDYYLENLAKKMNVDKAGALVVYTADDDKWHVRIGFQSAESFTRGPRRPDGTKPPLVKSADLPIGNAIEQYLKSAGDWGADLIEKAKQAVPPNDSGDTNQKLKLRVDAMLDELIFRLEPAAG